MLSLISWAQIDPVKANQLKILLMMILRNIPMDWKTPLENKNKEKFDRYLGEHIYKNSKVDGYFKFFSMATTKYPRQNHS